MLNSPKLKNRLFIDHFQKQSFFQAGDPVLLKANELPFIKGV